MRFKELLICTHKKFHADSDAHYNDSNRILNKNMLLHRKRNKHCSKNALILRQKVPSQKNPFTNKVNKRVIDSN